MEKNNLPTAEELAYKVFFDGITDRKPNEELKFREMYAKTFSKPIPSKDYGWKNGRVMEPHDTVKAMIEFAKLHVEEALKAASENVKHETYEFDGKQPAIDKKTILNAYPLTNIK